MTAKRAPGKPATRVRRVGSSAERADAALDLAARRVPAWQVSAAALAIRLSTDHPNPACVTAAQIAGQLPPEVRRAGELHLLGKWKPAVTSAPRK